MIIGSVEKDIPSAVCTMKPVVSPKRSWFLAGISWNSKPDIHFHETNKTVTSECYMNLLDVGLISDCRRFYPENDFIFKQDGAPSHVSCAGKDEWPPQSSDLNDRYTIWDSLEKV